MTTLTKKHFEFIADVLHEAEAHPDLIDLFAERLAETNPLFNRERFITEATYTDDTGAPDHNDDQPVGDHTDEYDENGHLTPEAIVYDLRQYVEDRGGDITEGMLP